LPALEQQSDAYLEDTYWKLVELKGEPVTVLPSHQEAHFVLMSTEHRVRGSGGCNLIMGSYETAGDRLSFGPLATTRKMCPEIMQQEQAFLAVLDSVTHYRIVGNHLQLIAHGELVAKLEAVVVN
jgi:heat shock protein HslJ